MSTFPKNYPFGKGMWIWNLPACVGGSIPGIIQKCKDNNISYVLVKSGDGESTWEVCRTGNYNGKPQWTKELVDAFHAAGLKIYSWSYVYGRNPQREANIALWSLDMGADGHVFDAESEYEHLPNNAQAATTMMTAVRQKYPDAFIAYSPFPIVSYHRGFPYTEFSRYSSAVMPQAYWNGLQKSPIDTVNWTFSEWLAQEETWRKNGQSECIKPLIFAGSSYDYGAPINYVLNPGDLQSFITAVKGYKSVNFWSFEHIIRNDCWDAIKNTPVDQPTNADLGLPEQPVQQQTPPSTPPATVPTNTTGSTQTPAQPVENTPSPTPQAASADPAPATNSADTATHTPVGEVPLPTDGSKVTVTVKTDPNDPNKCQVVVHDKVAIDYIQDFFRWLGSKLKGGGK